MILTILVQRPGGRRLRQAVDTVAVLRIRAEYWLRPPASVDAEQTLVPLPSKRTLLPEPAQPAESGQDG